MHNLLTKISNLVKRAVITLTNDDSKNISHCQATYLDKVSPIETIYPYGFGANAPVGNIVLLFNIGANEANLAGIPYSQKDRFKNLKSGEVVVGSPKTGSYIKFLENGDIEILSKEDLKIDYNGITTKRLLSIDENKNIKDTGLINWAHTHDLIITDDGNGGVYIDYSNGNANQVLGMNIAGTDQEYKSITGTTEQIDITNSPNEINISAPLTAKRLPYLEGTGLIEEFSFTITGATTFNIAPGKVQVIDNYTDVENPTRKILNTPAVTGVVPIGLGLSVRTYLYWDVSSGTPVLIQALDFLPRLECRTKILFGTVIHADLASINYIYRMGFYVSQMGQMIEDFYYTFLSNKVVEIKRPRYWPQGHNLNLKFSVSNTSLINGELLSNAVSTNVGRYITTMVAQDPVPYMFLTWIDNNGIPYNTISPYIDPNHYRKPDGTLGLVPTGYWSVPRMYYFASGEKVIMYGLDVYPSDRLALQYYLNEDWYFLNNSRAAEGAFFSCYLIVKQGATDLLDPAQAIFSDRIDPIRINPVDIVNRGVSGAFSVIDEGGINISWSSGVIYDVVTRTTKNISSSAGSIATTNNSINYLYWVSGTTLTLNTTKPSGNNVTIATIFVQAGDIYSIVLKDILIEREANLIRGISNVFPTKIITGLMIEPDTNITYAFDVKSNAGLYYYDLTKETNVPIIYSRITPMIRHYHSSGVWTSSTNAQIDIDYYDDGTNLTLMNLNWYAKSVFIIDGAKIHWVYPRAQYVNITNALTAPLPEIPPGLKNLPIICAYIHKRGDAALAPVGDQRWIDLRGLIV